LRKYRRGRAPPRPFVSAQDKKAALDVAQGLLLLNSVFAAEVFHPLAVDLE